MHSASYERTVYSANFPHALRAARAALARDEATLVEARALPDGGPLVAYLAERVDTHHEHLAAFDAGLAALREAEGEQAVAIEALRRADGRAQAGTTDATEAARLAVEQSVARQVAVARERPIAGLAAECRAHLDAIRVVDQAAHDAEKIIAALATIAATARKLVVKVEPDLWVERENPAMVLWEPLYVARALASYPEAVSKRPADGLTVEELRGVYKRRVEMRASRARARRGAAEKVLASP